MRARRRWWRRWEDGPERWTTAYAAAAALAVVAMTLLLIAVMHSPSCYRHTTAKTVAAPCRR
jgi:hypothetical protein